MSPLPVLAIVPKPGRPTRDPELTDLMPVHRRELRESRPAWQSGRPPRGQRRTSILPAFGRGVAFVSGGCFAMMLVLVLVAVGLWVTFTHAAALMIPLLVIVLASVLARRWR